MTTERRKSPRRKITQVDKTGSWGNVSYHHHLSCGHIEIRKRPAATDQIACPWCLRAEEKNEEFKKFKKPSIFSITENNIIDDEIRIERSRAAIASNFGVPIDAVDVSVEDLSGQLIIMGATIYLSSEDVDKINRLR